ncbi:MAG: outer membrane lipoprotein-sorting protein, partial [Acidobacteria bacterium]|nr:outer membrane lipoprotein-sorting protein [Acidobacteriota bacterium]
MRPGAIFLSVALVTALAVSAPRPLTAQIDGAALLAQIDRQLNPPSYEAYKRIVNIEPNGRTREYLLYQIADGREKVAALFLSPASDKGRSTLRLGDNMWLYVPNAGRPIRITSLQSVVGGVFNNADILTLDYSAEYDVENVDASGEEYRL